MFEFTPHGWAVPSLLDATPPPVEVGRRPLGRGGGGGGSRTRTEETAPPCHPHISMMQQEDYVGSSQFVHLCPSLSDRAPRRGVVSRGSDIPASPPKVLTIYGVSAVNAHVRNVPNRLLSPLWQSLHLMETSVVFTAHFTPAHPTFTALRVRTVHPKPKLEVNFRNRIFFGPLTHPPPV